MNRERERERKGGSRKSSLLIEVDEEGREGRRRHKEEHQDGNVPLRACFQKSSKMGTLQKTLERCRPCAASAQSSRKKRKILNDVGTPRGKTR